jgi:hypothetical protein
LFGEEASEAASAAAKLGARGAKALQEMMPKVAPGLRRYIAAALGSAGTASGDAAAVEFLLDKDPGVVASAVRSLISQVPTLTASKKHVLTEQLLHLLKDTKTNLPIASAAARAASSAMRPSTTRPGPGLGRPRTRAVRPTSAGRRTWAGARTWAARATTGRARPGSARSPAGCGTG